LLQTRGHPPNHRESVSVPDEQGMVGDKHRQGVPASPGKQKTDRVAPVGL